jgi:hypothetical protein
LHQWDGGYRCTERWANEALGLTTHTQMPHQGDKKWTRLRHNKFHLPEHHLANHLTCR